MASALLQSLLDEETLSAVGDKRRATASALLRDGLPRPRDEAWKYTSVRALEQRRYANGDVGALTRSLAAHAFELPGVDGVQLVFVNGAYRADLSRIAALEGVTITPLAVEDVASSSHGSADAGGAESRSDAFQRLNTALVGTCLRVHVAAGVRVAEPIHLVFAGVAAQTDVAWQARTRFELAERASLRVIEHHVAADANAHFGNLVAHYAVGAQARLDLLQIQQASDAATLIRRDTFEVSEDALLSLRTLETGSQLTRHEVDVDLAGSRARFESRGVFALHGRQHCDSHLDIRHNAGATISDIVWRGVADERARGVFHGAIVIAPGADGADAKLSNKNLLLSSTAEIDTQPALEIYADEVKAAHGATVGQLDEGALFYLRSRGIALGVARQLLVSGFCREMFADIKPLALRDHLDAMLSAHLSIEFS